VSASGIDYAGNMMKSGTCLALLLLPVLVWGQVYRQTTKDGTVIFTDRPSEDAEEVEIGPLQTIAPFKVPFVSGTKDPVEAEFYDHFAITAPSHDATVQSGAGNMTVTATLSPGLRSGHRVEIFLDGATISSGNGLTATLTNVDRGTHSLSAAIMDGEGKEVLRTGGVIFHMKRRGEP